MFCVLCFFGVEWSLLLACLSSVSTYLKPLFAWVSFEIGSSLSVSGRVQSASALNQRGVSYPPPSPRGLTRAQPVPQSRNPPLVKTRRLASMAGLINVQVTDAAYQQSASSEATNPNADLADTTSMTIRLTLLIYLSTRCPIG